MLFPPAKTYTKQTTFSFAQAPSSSSSSASNPSFAVPSGSCASHSTNPSLPSMPESASSAVPSGPESTIGEPLIDADEIYVMEGDPFDGDEDDGVVSAKGEGRWEHPK
ncbi:hypothetical protein MVLG_01668 [Microbotryum lychnidis-dioicae p1A1 Lamole]|uniref:Uncharacterized protein n=1 Tax=Microbotryum lychnidis-dioicae (strain p1A1 Lamole / MvSl-1064) TaxID=683840 RepID=U5H2T6_USTV1|nr:hypothetical protein MVLG_01668 [Microbotryum lychnidis-dioicae p1A1 Lamole]|eukprot:KDE08189.1 hypothetical protein MVLG_01668 [Microbotryum lychnidis-dioicae p1A1 Lamole]